MIWKETIEWHQSLENLIATKIFQMMEVFDKADEDGEWIPFVCGNPSIAWECSDNSVYVFFEDQIPYEDWTSNYDIEIPYKWFEMSEQDLAQAYRNKVELDNLRQERVEFEELKRRAEYLGYTLVSIDEEE